MNNTITIDVKANTVELDMALAKVYRLIELIKEAKTLADDLASDATKITLQISVLELMLFCVGKTNKY